MELSQTITVLVPDSAQVVRNGIAVAIARRGETRSASPLGGMGKRRGVYVIHQGGRVLYVGKTGGAKMDFATRLRREFQESAAQGRHITRS